MTNDKQPEVTNGKAIQSPDDQSVSKPAGKTGAPAGGKPGDTRRNGGGGALLARLFVLLLIVGALAVGGWFGWQWLKREKSAYDAVIASQSAELSRLETRLNRIEETRVAQDEFENLDESLTNAQARLRDRMDVIANEMEALREAAQGGRRDLIKAEVEYLLRIAADELYLTQDVDTAIYALQAADDRLRQLAEPRLNPVRQLIADHLRALGAVNMPDTSGMALKLGSLVQEVSSWPLRQAQHANEVDVVRDAAPADASWWQRFQAGVARLFDKLVVVQRAEPPPPLLTPEEHFFLYRNVELQLAAARTALLAGDAAAYRQSLEMAREWLNRFFDKSNPVVNSAIADISGLLDVSLQPSLPDITPALERFRALTGNTVRPTGARTE